MSSETHPSTKKKRGIPWYVYFVGSSIYTALGGWLAADSSPLAIVCILSAPVGFFYAWRAWKEEKHHRGRT
jgi:hypothetical protein